MLRVFLILTLISFSFNSYAEKCEGINACIDLYSRLTGHKLIPSVSITDDMSLAVADTDLNSSNAQKEFEKFLNKNIVSINGDKLMANRHGDFLAAPAYIVSEGNIPMMIDGKGLVTLVYSAKGNTIRLVNSARKMLSKKMPNAKNVNNIMEFKATKIISVSDTYETAVKIIKIIMKQDK